MEDAKQATLTAHARLSNHNAEQDRTAWAHFTQAVRELSRQPQYADLDIVVDSVEDTDQWT
ncbi:hypothetical protein [Paractinoplanes rishiriensis]|uniref:Uncharacterized protein n=1 Tax=Paractinoplanes rishiriensis TaxID=1050105 RepID=A0A919K8E2_9ACTN|nr:hypothetical protein [Actinoplanes rishiriensis]GIF01283.1 hypothetical protein Ari01nite_87470 [Actinoplanes rishiriensis]